MDPECWELNRRSSDVERTQVFDAVAWLMAAARGEQYRLLGISVLDDQQARVSMIMTIRWM